MKKIFIVQDRRTGFHVVIEVLPSSYKFKYESGLDFVLFNKLIHWKNLNDLFSLLEETGPLVDKNIYEKESRIVGINQFIDNFSFNSYKNCNLTNLRMELFLDNKKGFYSSKRSISKATELFGLIESDGIKELEEWAKKDASCKVAIEPLHDFVVMRNLCSVILRLIANYQNPMVEHPIEESGFAHINRAKKEPFYEIPIWNTLDIDRSMSFSTNHFNQINVYETAMPLYCAIEKTKGIGYSLYSSQEAYSADNKAYLGIKDNLFDQHKLIEGFVKEFGDMFRYLRADKREEDGSLGGLLSWEEKTPSPEENVSFKRNYKTLAGAVAGTLFYRTDTVPITCRNCGKGMLIRNKGKRKEFCSASCKSQYYKVTSTTD